jgi:hypothetical protein
MKKGSNSRYLLETQIPELLDTVLHNRRFQHSDPLFFYVYFQLISSPGGDGGRARVFLDDLGTGAHSSKYHWYVSVQYVGRSARRVPISGDWSC